MTELADRLSELGWISDLWVAGSLATGDYVPGVSDVDLVAVVKGPADRSHRDVLAYVHRELDTGAASGCDLGCAYVHDSDLAVLGTPHVPGDRPAAANRPHRVDAHARVGAGDRVRLSGADRPRSSGRRSHGVALGSDGTL